MSPDPSNNPFLQFFKTDDKELKAFVERVLNAYKKLEQEQATSAEAITKKALEEAKKLNDEHEKLTKERLEKEKQAQIAAMEDKKKQIEEEFNFKKSLIEQSIALLQKQKDDELKRKEEQKQKVAGNIQAEQALEADKAAIILSYKDKIDAKNAQLHQAEKKRTDEIAEYTKKKYETIAQTVGKTFSKIGDLIGGKAGTTIAKVGTTITSLENAFETISTSLKNAKKTTIGEKIIGAIDGISSNIANFKEGYQRVSGWDLLDNTTNSAAAGAQYGPIGAVAGAVGGFGSTILGWLFGGGARKLQRELTTIGQINDMVTKNLSALSSRTNQLASTAGSGNFLDELQGQIGQIQEQIGYERLFRFSC